MEVKKKRAASPFLVLTKRVLVSGLFLIILLADGCALPLAVFPAPNEFSSKAVRFQDQDGKPVDQDGLLMVTYIYHTSGYLRPHPSSHVVDIRRGVATLPVEWVLHSTWLGFVERTEVATLPFVESRLMAFVPGYWAEAASWDSPKGVLSLYQYEKRYWGNHWDQCMERIRCAEMGKPPHDPEKEESLAQFEDALSRADYLRLEQFVRDEMRRRGDAYPVRSTTRPQ